MQSYILSLIADLIVHSKSKNENIHNLNKMAIIRRILLMISYNIISETLLPEIAGHLKILLKGNWTGENIKLVGTFLINMLPKGKF